MADPAPAGPDDPGRYTVVQFMDLVRQGVLGPDDRVELLEGVIVAVAPSNPWHAVVVERVAGALRRAVGERGAVRAQHALVLEPSSIPEPDVAVVPGRDLDYLDAHPTHALLVVECADTSLPQDRLSKSRMYARAGIPEYWIVSRRDDAVEVMRDPDRATAAYRERRLARRGARIELAACSGVGVAVDELLPPTRV
jgi:Uma2 family endonuclease